MNMNVDAPEKKHFQKRNGKRNGWNNDKPKHKGPQYQIKVSNLHYGVSKDDLKELFGFDGKLIRVYVHYDESGRSLGAADIYFNCQEGVDLALSTYQGQELDGMAMAIEKVANLDSRLGQKNVFSRLGARLDDRLGSRIDNRLGKKVQPKKKRISSKSKTSDQLDAEMDSYMQGETEAVVVDPTSGRQLASHPDTVASGEMVI